jgi:prepilin-type N-terminal cleavage/methylation domain-containing protein
MAAGWEQACHPDFCEEEIKMKDCRGFTVVELMIALALLAVVLAGIYTTFGSQERAYILQDQMAEMNQNARVALEFMSKDIRNAAFDPTAAIATGAGAGIETATATSIVFTQDVTEDGDLDDEAEYVGYRFDAANDEIDRCTGGGACGAWESFTDQVQNLQFNYVLADETSTQAPGVLDEIREVEIQVVARRKAHSTHGFQNITLTSKVKVRNMALR